MTEAQQTARAGRARTDANLLHRARGLAVLAELRRGAPRTLTELAAATGLSRPVAEAASAELARLGWTVEEGPSAEPGVLGRPARRIRFRAEAGHILGVDIDVHGVRALAADLDGTVVGRAEAETAADAPPDTRLDAARNTGRRALDAAGIAPGDLRRLVIGTTGIVDRDGTVVNSSALPGWTGLDLAGRARGWAPCPVLAENDTRLAARAEQWLGTAQGVDDAVYLFSGARTGTALILGGRLHRGFGGAAGEIGVLPLIGWAGHHRELAAAAGPGDPPDRRTAAVLDAAAAGRPAARRAVEAFARGLADGVAAVVLTVDPELLVLGGRLPASGEVLADPLRRALERLCPRVPRIGAAAVGADCVALGAVRLGLDSAEAEWFAPDSAEPLPEAGA